MDTNLEQEIKKDSPKVAPIKVDGTEVFEHGEDTATAEGIENEIGRAHV